jgi:hypothetical protein
MNDVSERIAAWEATGLIDAATAERLRTAEAVAVPTDPAGAIDLDHGDAEHAEHDHGARGTGVDPGSGREASQVAAWFGPSVTIPEVFGYLGAAFLLAGWTTFLGRTSLGFGDAAMGPALGALIASVGLVVLGLVLGRGDERQARSAGVCFLVAVAYFGGGIASLATVVGLDWPAAVLVGAGAALALAIGLRWVRPAVLTQVGLLGAVTALTAAILAWGESVLDPNHGFDQDTGLRSSGAPDPLLLVLASAALWLTCAVVIGLIGLSEARAGDRGDVGAARRAAISRFWAGLVAVLGLAMSLTRSAEQPNGDYERVVKAWVGELAILVTCAVLLERAFRRDATAYVYAAALGLIIALSDFNFTYLSDSTEIGLLIEGAILLGVGFAADRLRRRIGHPDPGGGSLGAATATSL